MNSERRCGAASILGATVMQGRDATARLADRLARHGDNATAMQQVAARLRANTSSFEVVRAGQPPSCRGPSPQQGPA